MHRDPPPSFLSGLDLAHAALDRGDYVAARDMAQDVVDRTPASGDDLSLARANLFLAHCDRLVSKLRPAYRASQHAVGLYQKLGDREGEALALATHSYISVSLGQTTQAVESAMLATLISDKLGRPDVSTFAYNYLGFAYLWVHAFDDGVAALERATACARRLGPSAGHAFQPQVTLASVEATRIAMARASGRPSPPLAPLLGAIECCEAIIREHGVAGARMGMEPTMRALHRSFSAVAHCWVGDIDLADRHLADAAMWSGKYPFVTWLDALQQWVKSEVALAQGDLARAESHLRQAIEVAASVEHETFGCMMRRVLIHNLQMQERRDQAFAEATRLREQEDRIRLASLEGRRDVVAWQLALRDSKDEIDTLAARSADFERLSNQDALTGLPNRRHFESVAQRMLEVSGGERMCVVWIDVDRFKDVNDNHSHQVGDRVLCLVADALRSAVRARDLAARWAGDEFVVALPDTAVSDAEPVIARIRAAVEAMPFGEVVPGLAVSVSVGMACANPGEGLDSLLRRSDLSMYRDKRMSDR